MNDPPEGYKRYHPTGCQSLPKPGELKILGWGQDSLVRVERGGCDLTKKTMRRPEEAAQETASPSDVHTACAFQSSCPILLFTLHQRRPQWDWLYSGPGPAFIHAQRLLFAAGKLQADFGVNDGDICCVCSYACFIAQGQTNKCLLSTPWRMQLKSIWVWK